VRIDIVCAVGEEAKASYSLAVKVPGRARERFDDLPCDAMFKALTWMGWTASATEEVVFYVDDVYLRPRK
jgi:hypothetical protein